MKYIPLIKDEMSTDDVFDPDINLRPTELYMI